MDDHCSLEREKTLSQEETIPERDAFLPGFLVALASSLYDSLLTAPSIADFCVSYFWIRIMSRPKGLVDH